MHKADSSGDFTTDPAIEHRRTAEAARKARIFNTRSRVMGLDLSALDQQVQAKERQQYTERLRDQAYDTLRLIQDEALLQQERDERDKRAELHTNLTHYWKSVEDSSDAVLKYDLEEASTLTIPEAELGPASMQIFQGEDLGEEERRRAQMEKTERDLRAQKEADKKRYMEDKHKELSGGRRLLLLDRRAVELEALEDECKKADRIALSDYNLTLAAERAEKLRQQRAREERESLAEVWHMVTSDMLTERPEAAERDVSVRVLTDRWRGMSPEQLDAIRKEREKQCFERQKRCRAERIVGAGWDFHYMKLSREAVEEEERAAELQREMRARVDQTNIQLAGEQQEHQDYLNKKLYTNKPTVDYFDQFNTSSR